MMDASAFSFRGLDCPGLVTERLLLRPLRPEDAEALLRMYSEPEVCRYGSTPPWTSLDQATAMIAREQKSLAGGEVLCLALVRREDQVFVGTCTLFHVHGESRRAELGYALAPQAWGHGYMDEALRALLGLAFGPLGLNRLEADVDPRNAGSLRSLERLGFRREGLMPERWIVGGEVADTAFYGLLARDWLQGGIPGS